MSDKSEAKNNDNIDQNQDKSEHPTVNTSEEAIDKYLKLAKKFDMNPAHLAIQFVTTRPFVTSNIIGATSMEQLKVAISSTDIKITDEILAEIEDIHLSASNLCP